MPRDLGRGLSQPIPLTESPTSTTSPINDVQQQQKDQADKKKLKQHDNALQMILGSFETEQPAESLTLHPYTSPLTISDVESCVALENAAFENENERCSKEKFEYRLARCGALSLGIFTSALPTSKMPAETLATGRPVESGRSNGAVSVLMAHIVCTLSNDPVVTDEAMDLPEAWRTTRSTKSGHQEFGSTICLHSLAVLPSYQGRGLGMTIMTSFLQQMSSAGIAKRIALIAHEHMIPYYEKFGFKSKGQSKAQFGGGGWFDMTFELREVEARTMYG